MGSGNSSVPAAPNSDDLDPVTANIRISVRGSRETGKSSLIGKMRGARFQNVYVPTASIESSRIVWKSIMYTNVVMNVDIWDVIEEVRCITDDEPDCSNDASSADVPKQIDGILVMYDPRRPETVTTAVRIIEATASQLPIIVVANFLDKRKRRLVVPANIMRYADRIVHIQASVRTNRGLPIIAKWLDQVYMYCRYRTHQALYEQTYPEMDRIRESVKSMSDRECGVVQQKERTYVTHKRIMMETTNPEGRPSLAALLQPKKNTDTEVGEEEVG